MLKVHFYIYVYIYPVAGATKTNYIQQPFDINMKDVIDHIIIDYIYKLRIVYIEIKTFKNEVKGRDGTVTVTGTSRKSNETRKRLYMVRLT